MMKKSLALAFTLLIGMSTFYSVAQERSEVEARRAEKKEFRQVRKARKKEMRKYRRERRSIEDPIGVLSVVGTVIVCMLIIAAGLSGTVFIA